MRRPFLSDGDDVDDDVDVVVVVVLFHFILFYFVLDECQHTADREAPSAQPGRAPLLPRQKVPRLRLCGHVVPAEREEPLLRRAAVRLEEPLERPSPQSIEHWQLKRS